MLRSVPGQGVTGIQVRLNAKRPISSQLSQPINPMPNGMVRFSSQNTPGTLNGAVQRLLVSPFEARKTQALFQIHAASVPKLQRALIDMLMKPGAEIPEVLLRAREIDLAEQAGQAGQAEAFSIHNPEAFQSQLALKEKLQLSDLPTARKSQAIRWVSELAGTPESAYLMSHILALETALKRPDLQLYPANKNLPKLIELGLEDAKAAVSVGRNQPIYGKEKTPINNTLYQLILKSPKVILHEHARGSVPVALYRAYEISRKGNNTFLSNEDLQEFCRIQRLFTEDGSGPNYLPSLNKFREKYDIVSKSVYSAKTAYLAAYLYALRVGIENVRYFEYRLNPRSRDVKDPQFYIKAVQQGIDDAREFLYKTRGQKIDGNIIISTDRQPKPGVKTSPMQLADEILDIAIKARQSGLRVCGFDIQGDEQGYAVTDYADVANKLKAYNNQMVAEGHPEKRIGATIHAGETFQSGVENRPDSVLEGWQSVEQAIKLFWDPNTPLRIGHGIQIRDNMNLIQECIDKGIGIEQCPKSNVQTWAVSYYKDHPAMSFLRSGLLVSISCDNRTLCKSDPNNELVKLTRHKRAQQADRRKFQMNGAQTAFIFEPGQKQSLLGELQHSYQSLESQPRFQQIIQAEQDPRQFQALVEDRYPLN